MSRNFHPCNMVPVVILLILLILLLVPHFHVPQVHVSHFQRPHTKVNLSVTSRAAQILE